MMDTYYRERQIMEYMLFEEDESQLSYEKKKVFFPFCNRIMPYVKRAQTAYKACLQISQNMLTLFE